MLDPRDPESDADRYAFTCVMASSDLQGNALQRSK